MVSPTTIDKDPGDFLSEWIKSLLAEKRRNKSFAQSVITIDFRDGHPIGVALKDENRLRFMRTCSNCQKQFDPSDDKCPGCKKPWRN